MVSMIRKDETEQGKPESIAMADEPDVPYGCCGCFTEAELDKLGLSVPDRGDELEMIVRIKVNRVSYEDGPFGDKRCVNWQMIDIEPVPEDEAAEEMTEQRRNRWYKAA